MSPIKSPLAYNDENLLAIAEYGDPNGFPLLVQHGLIAGIDDSKLFDPLVALGARVICMARPGYGDSNPYAMHSIAEWGKIVATAVAELGLAQFDVLGMSSGAPYSYAIGHQLARYVRNIFIFSGVPALYDERVIAQWPYPLTKNASRAELQKLAYELFFANASEQDLAKKDMQDSMRNECFGIALDLHLRANDWGFTLAEVPENVYMRHSRFDPAIPVATAELTCNLLPRGTLQIIESDVHFSQAALDDYIKTVIAPHYRE